MDKDIITRFISKYAVGGAVESAKISVNNKVASTAISTTNKTLAGIVTFDNIEIEDSEFGVYDTPRLQKILSVLDSTIYPQMKYTNGRPTYISFKDGYTTVDYMLADLSVIPKPMKLTKLPAWDLEVTIDSEFSSRFIKAKGAMADSEYFTVTNEDGIYNIVIGYSEINSTRVNINTFVPCTSTNHSPISFSAPYLKEILVANRDAKTGTLRVSNAGIANVEFSGEDFTANYYLVKFNI